MKKFEETLKNNLERVETLLNEGLTIAPEGYPLCSWIEISPIDACNRACSFCPKSDSAVAPNTWLEMDSSLYQKIASELESLRYQGTVMLAGYGEPLLYKGIADMVKTFSRFCNVEITTNGDPLRPTLIEKLYEAGVGKIIVSLYDGPHQVGAFEELIKKSRVPRNLFILRDRWYGEGENFGLKLTNRAGTVSVGAQPPVKRTHPCFYPHYMMMVDWNGEVHVCTQDWNRKVVCGDLKIHSIGEVWNGPVFKRYRELLASGDRSLLPCRDCNAEGTLHGKKHMELWKRFYEK